jgi:hypothetical protein
MSTGERVCWGLTFLGAGAAAAPFVADKALEPMGDARFAMAMVGLLVGLTSFICVFLFRSRNRVRAGLRAGKTLLVRWTYSEAEWRAFAGEETQRQASGKRTLLWITGSFMLIATLVVVAIDRKAAVFVGAVLLGTWILCYLAARASMRASQKNEKGPPPEARISADGLMLGAEFHAWRGWGARLERCALVEGTPPQVEIVYSTPQRYSRTETSVRVPVPAGRESEAAGLARRLRP